MLDIEQRVKMVEERMADHTQLFAEIKQGLLQFQAQVDRRFEQVDRRFDQFEARVDRRFEQVEARFVSLEQKFDARLTGLELRLTGSDQKVEAGLAGVNQKIDGLGLSLIAQRNDMHAQFRWTAGIILTGLVAIVAAILAR